MTVSTSLVSVIIPTLNEERYIGSCLRSVLEQECGSASLEVLVVDGGSTDRTREIVQDFIIQGAPVRLLENPNVNQASAFNIGFRSSSGDLIVRMDAHAEYNAGYIRRCMERHAEGSYGNVGGRCMVKPGAPTRVAKAVAIMNMSRFAIGGAAFRTGEEEKLTDSVPFGSFPRRVVEELGGMNESLKRGEDNDFNARIRKRKWDVLFDPQIKSSYFARDTLWKFLRQMLNNGYSIGILLWTHSRAVGLRHLVPLFFLMYLVLVPWFFLLLPWLLWPWMSLLCVYVILDLLSACRASRGSGFFVFLVVFAGTFLTHLSYGIGTIHGLADRTYR